MPEPVRCKCQLDRNGHPIQIGQRARIRTHPRGTVEGTLEPSPYTCGECNLYLFRIRDSTDDRTYGPVSGDQILIIDTKVNT